MSDTERKLDAGATLRRRITEAGAELAAFKDTPTTTSLMRVMALTKFANAIADARDEYDNSVVRDT